MTCSDDPLGEPLYGRDNFTQELLRVVDRPLLACELQHALDIAEDDVTDFIAADYVDEDIVCVGDEIFDWALVALREVGGRLQAACSVEVALYRDDENESSVGTTYGSCWCLVEFAASPWRGAALTPGRFAVVAMRGDLVSWPSRCDREGWNSVYDE